ncbi:hypothetical protein [Mycobacterium decipiens]|uniref:Secreted protein n=1 Tax=Mycobacterium decipiens TaxID=1430326 RepID=A0A1X2LT51_9MYCO|nr:hypothetical protein [Mycobacterium decipiens]OSC39968.1 hypothetical protein B8W66_14980 [Mycobacterium decipiens]
MRSVGTIATVMLVTATAFSGLGPASSARASKDDVAINGTYRATSIGQYAKTRETYHDEATVVSTWTIRSTCTTTQDCTGTVTSDQGWSAPLYMHDGTMWYVKHEVPNWERCEDGTAFTGQQTFTFYAVDSNGLPQTGSPTLAGKDRTVGPSGACGQNQWLTVEMPFRLDKIG